MTESEKNFNSREHWSKSLKREVELTYAWETIKGYFPRLNFKTAFTIIAGSGALTGCAEATSQRIALATETTNPPPAETFTVIPSPTLTETPLPSETATVTPSPTESCIINGVTFTEANRHPDGGYRYPSGMSKIDKPLNQWTQAEKTTIVDATGNPIYEGVRAINQSAWVRENNLNYAGAWIGRGCGYGLMFNNDEGNRVWATDNLDRVMGRPDGNGLGAGVQEIPNPPVEGRQELVVGKEQTLVLVRNIDQIIGKYNPVTQKWEIFSGFEATSTPPPEVINYPGVTDPITWGRAVDLAAVDCDQNLIYEYATNPEAGDIGGMEYFSVLMNRAFNIQLGPPPTYNSPPEVQGYRGMRLPEITCWILWLKYNGEQYLVYPNNGGQTVIIPVSGGPGYR